MEARKPLGNKVRFEVFRRDSFKCQYCGKSAPDVVLNVDHINPVSKGGTNDMFNLITSCYECNQGKKARKLTDQNEISKQKRQLDLLNERRVQLDMLLDWKNSLIKSNDKDAKKIGRYIIKKLGTKEHEISDTGIQKINAFLKKLPASRVIELIDETVDQLSGSIAYFGVTDKTFEIVFSMLTAKYKSETATHKQKVQYLLKQFYWHHPNANSDSYETIKESLDVFLESRPDLFAYQTLQRLVKETTAQEFYECLEP